jgi:hypothetical protein
MLEPHVLAGEVWMIQHNVEQAIREQLQHLAHDEQRQVLDFARALALAHRPHGVPGKELLRFAGTIAASDLAEMTEAIETGCEKVDTNEW